MKDKRSELLAENHRLLERITKLERVLVTAHAFLERPINDMNLQTEEWGNRFFDLDEAIRDAKEEAPMPEDELTFKAVPGLQNVFDVHLDGAYVGKVGCNSRTGMWLWSIPEPGQAPVWCSIAIKMYDTREDAATDLVGYLKLKGLA